MHKYSMYLSARHSYGFQWLPFKCKCLAPIVYVPKLLTGHDIYISSMFGLCSFFNQKVEGPRLPLVLAGNLMEWNHILICWFNIVTPTMHCNSSHEESLSNNHRIH